MSKLNEYFQTTFRDNLATTYSSKNFPETLNLLIENTAIEVKHLQATDLLEAKRLLAKTLNVEHPENLEELKLIITDFLNGDLKDFR